MERKQRQLQEKYNLSGLEHLEEERDEEPATLPVKRTLSRQVVQKKNHVPERLVGTCKETSSIERRQ